MFVVIDSGTTNTRLYLAREDSSILAVKEEKIGGRDVSVEGSNKRIKETIERLYKELLQEVGVSSEQVDFITASGMITSEIGLIELPHLIAPAGVQELAEGIYVSRDPNQINLGKPVYFIRGVKNCVTENLQLQEFLRVDFMRGEEIQYPGIVKRMGITCPCNIITLSSHTKICYMDADGRITFSQTTISGQLYEALREKTFIGKSVMSREGEKDTTERYEEIVAAALDFAEKAGLLHIFMVPRFMEVLTHTTAAERRLFVNAAIAADDMKTISHMQHTGYLSDQFAIYGKKDRCELYANLLKKAYPGCSVRLLTDPQEIARCGVCGAYEIVKARKEEPNV